MKSKSKSKLLHCYCWASGRIEFGPIVPKTAIAIASGENKSLRDAVAGCCRMSYPSKPGNRIEYPLVPGVPEADPQSQAAIDAVIRFSKEIKKRLLWATNPIILDMDTFTNRGEAPEPMTMAIFRNDLLRAMTLAVEDKITAEQLFEALRHKHNHIVTNDINKALKKYHYVK